MTQFGTQSTKGLAMIIDILAGGVIVGTLLLARYVWVYRKRPGPWYINTPKEQAERIGKRRAEERKFGRCY